MVGFIFAVLAILSQPQAPAAEFTEGLLANCHAVVQPGTFIGCEVQDWTQDETLYAGLIWQDGQPLLVTGP